MTDLHSTAAASRHAPTGVRTIDTDFGRVAVDPSTVRLGELFVTEDGAEVEVVGLQPLVFVEAPEEDEDWGE